MHLTVKDIEAEWQAMRGLTLDLLDTCSPQDLAYAAATCGPVWKQFRHIGGIHEVYLDAIHTGQIRFDGSGKSYSGDATGPQLRAYFDRLQKQHAHMLQATPPQHTIDWFGEAVPLPMHLARLISHETLHHGQFILQWQARGVPMPASWQAWGV